MTRLLSHVIVCLSVSGCPSASLLAADGSADPRTVRDAEAALRRAIEFFHGRVASHGGYVYHYSLDLQQRWGEGIATSDQIWVQPPGTPTVGLAFLEAYAATGEARDLAAATQAAHALVYGQLQSGGWQNCVDFNPRGDKVHQYRNGRGGGKNYSSLDDGQTQSALLFLIRVDAAVRFQEAKIHDAVQYGLNALLAAQFPNGGFPQVWSGPVSPQPVRRANYPPHDWRTEGRVKNYWDMYTLNDNVPGYVARTLLAAHETYGEERFLAALRKLGDFLLLAQMPDPQPGWAQQYNYDMQPIWARKFEPPAVTGDETQEAVETLLLIARATGDSKYLEPIPRALDYLERSLLPDGRLARYYELRTNRPLYMERRGDDYTLTYDDSNLPDHYGWKVDSRIAELRRGRERVRSGLPLEEPVALSTLERQAREIIAALDADGRWVSIFAGERLVGQPKFSLGTQYLSSETFSRNVALLSDYLRAARSTAAGGGAAAPQR
jgi:PelA/Pel-15E family pectate lyase